MKVTQSPMRPSAARQQRQVMAPPKPPNNPASPPAPARSGGGNGALNRYIQIVILRKKKLYLPCFVHVLTLGWATI
jgi:hypothetical protein